MDLFVYEVMSSQYVPPSSGDIYTPVEIPHLPSDDDKFFMKVINNAKYDIIVYLDEPPARKNEFVATKAQNHWIGWNGATRTVRGNTVFPENVKNGDQWTSRLIIASNSDPTQTIAPVMRA